MKPRAVIVFCRFILRLQFSGLRSQWQKHAFSSVTRLSNCETYFFQNFFVVWTSCYCPLLGRTTS